VSLLLKQSEYFWADLAKQVDWYRNQEGSEIAERFVEAVETTLDKLAEMPGLGQPRFADWPELTGIRSWRVKPPFQRLLIFYRFDSGVLTAERLIHGGRDLPRRLIESPFSEDD